MLRQLAIALVASAAPLTLASGQAATDSGGFVVMLGNDTLSAESFRVVPSPEECASERVEGMVMRRSPRVTIVRYTIDRFSNWRACRVRLITRLPDGGMPPNAADSIVVSYEGDDAVTQIHRGTVATQRRVTLSYPFPEIDGAVSLYAIPAKVMTEMDADSVLFHAYTAGAPGGAAMPAVRRSPTRFHLYSFGSPIELTTDGAGRLLDVDASRTTFRIRATRQTYVDVPALARHFAERERVTGPLTALSPRNSDSARVGAANVRVEYGSPAARGRAIWGPNGVLGDTLWRTGANASTQLRTDAPLDFAGRVLPAGQYAVTTLAIPGRYQLIFGAAGAEVLRVPLESAALAPAQERFTFSIESTGERSGFLRLRWDALELTAPFTVSR
jgi:hypothetical protein